MARSAGKTMKVDIALPLDIYNMVVRLAENAGAPIHHRSNQRVLSPTILQLIGLGIQSAKDSPELLTTPKPIGGIGHDSRVTALVDRIEKLEDSLKDWVTIDQVTEIARDEAHKATQSILDEVTKLKTKPTALVSGESERSGERLQFAQFALDHGLGIKRGDSPAEIRAALAQARLDGQYRYDSAIRAFYPLQLPDPLTK